MQDRPTDVELAAALALYLKDDLLPQLPKELQFGVRVAAGAAGLLAREAADPDRLAGLTPLAELLGEPAPTTRDAARDLQKRLAASIRAGEFDERLDEATAALLTHVTAKLAVAHPGYTA